MDPHALMRIKNLQLRSKLVVEGFFGGLHRSPLHGASVEFSEYRSYSPGDDPRGLDWKLFARTDRYYIKKFEDETNRRCHLLVDQSQSMAYGSLEYSKMDYARTLAATLAYFLTLQRDHVGLMTFDEAIADVVPARSRTGHLRQILACLDRPTAGKGTNLNRPLSQIAAVTQRRGLVVLISDMLAPTDELQRSLALLRSRQHEVIVLRVLDPNEVEISVDQSKVLVDMETGRKIQVDPDATRRSYQTAFREHADGLQAICNAVGAAIYTTTTDQPLQDSLSDFVSAHQRRPIAASRAGMLGGVGAGGGGGS
ncbi:DUF58 domain-containing protein [Rhodopirellula sp. JC740]|uniref:DUF58 domain-containing protein n=2 Tax=Rhodopirellula halodulae TaxID=2894198 RepID=A0ABS8NKL4_9BACT|nr:MULTISPECIES: DUF58 domain-containing protein [unclassified Rhodopirellula]MCC9644104.1 DUF58 domain-containing protein [Rhodopirellula sp. JC740]MCC9657264.1 DUF58 domain-containing protein [Rhodopirellula sp. JC737]